jgi:RNA polymerase sigma-70 factor (ECF subfamily)
MNDMLSLIQPLIPALRRYARALLRDRSAADDLVQDCLERAISRWHQRRADADPRTWVFAILHNLAMTRLCRTARRARHIAIEDAQENMFALAPSQEHGLRYRALLQALFAGGAENGAVARHRGGTLLCRDRQSPRHSVGTAMSRLSRARERLLKEMDGDEKPETAHPHLRRVK